MSLEHWTIMNGDSLTELKKLEKESQGIMFPFSASTSTVDPVPG